jgi:hypothetical protein
VANDRVKANTNKARHLFLQQLNVFFEVAMYNFLKKLFVVLLPLFFAATEVLAQEADLRRLPRQDAAVWAYYEFEYKLRKHWYVHYKNQYRFNENVSRFDYTFFDVGLDYQPKKWVNISGAYVFNLKNHLKRGVLFRHQVYANATFKHRFGDFRISSRNQIQSNIEDVFSAEEMDAQSLFYRNKIVLRWYAHKKWRFQATGEVYFRLGIRPPHEDYIYRQRYILGLTHRISKRDQIELYYLVQRQIRQRRPDYIYAIGVGYSRTLRF